MKYSDLIKQLDSASVDERLDAIKGLKMLIDKGELSSDTSKSYVNDHIHTKYSFSPYTPSAAVFYAWKAGLETCGIMDHETVAGCKEFIGAGRILNIPVTCGLECRVKMTNTALEGRYINNPYQKSIAYFVMHGIPHQMLEKVDDFFKPLREKRNDRNRLICDRFNEYFDFLEEIHVDYDKDVLPLSLYDIGGTVTERHICQAFAKQFIKSFTKMDILRTLELECEVPFADGYAKHFLALEGDELEYALIHLFKEVSMNFVYVDADEECVHIFDFIKLCDDVGAICAYPYLGKINDDAIDAPSLDCEDEYLEILAEELKKLNVCALTYMPSRNTIQQSKNIIELCNKNHFFQISGEDINSLNQPFVNGLLLEDMFSHLKDSTYAIIGNEILATNDIQDAMFSLKTKQLFPELDKRIKYYADIARRDEYYGD